MTIISSERPGQTGRVRNTLALYTCMVSQLCTTCSYACVLSSFLHHFFICPIIQQYAHLREYDSRRAGQQGLIRTLTAALKRSIKTVIGCIFYHTNKNIYLWYYNGARASVRTTCTIARPYTYTELVYHALCQFATAFRWKL